MERELIVTGIGGQGIQLLAKTLALAATNEQRHVLLSADYGGEMRGGPSKATVVIGDGPVRALPVLPSAGSVILAHHQYSEPVLERIRAGGLALANVPVVDVDALPEHLRIVKLDAAAIAKQADARQAGGFVMLGAYNALADLVPAVSLVTAMERLVPPYRQQFIPANARAIEAGTAAMAGLAGKEAVSA